MLDARSTPNCAADMGFWEQEEADSHQLRESEIETQLLRAKIMKKDPPVRPIVKWTWLNLGAFR